MNFEWNNHSISQNKSYCSKTWQNSSYTWGYFALLSWTANSCHFPAISTHFTMWFKVVHASEGKVPFSQPVLVQALLWSCQLLRLFLNVLIITQRQTKNLYTLLSRSAEKVCYQCSCTPRRQSLSWLSFNLNSESHRLECSASKSITANQDQCWNVLAGRALQYPSWAGKWKNNAAHVEKLKNQSTVTCFFYHGKRSNYKVIIEERLEKSMGTQHLV